MQSSPFLLVPAASVRTLRFLVSIALGLLWSLATLEAQPATDRAFLGVNTEQIRSGDERSGIRVTYIFPDSAGETIGLKVGDEIIALNDFLIPNTDTFVEQLRREKPPNETQEGSTLRFLIRRDGERLKLKGKIGSYRKTMNAFQEKMRKRMLGKPLPAPPRLKWWDAKTRDWIEKADGLSHCDGKVSVIVSFDDCPRCTQHRYDKFVKMKQVFQVSQKDAPVAFVGIYQSDYQELREGREKLFGHARGLFEKIPPNFPVAVAYYPDGPPKPIVRNEQQFYIHNHGCVILDPEGKVRYVQVLGIPEREFLTSYQELLLKYVKSKP